MKRTLQLQVPFAMVPEWVLDHPALSDRAKVLYGILARYGDRPFPSRPTLAARLRCSVDTVDRTLAALVAEGAVTVTARYEGGRQTSNEYQLQHLPAGGEGRVGAAPPSRVGAAPVTRATSNETILASAAAAAEREARNDLWEAVQLVCRIDPATVTKSARGALAKAVDELLAAGANPGLVKTRARVYRSRYPEAALTPSALAKHWPQLLTASEALAAERGGPEVHEHLWMEMYDDRGRYCPGCKRWENER